MKFTRILLLIFAVFLAGMALVVYSHAPLTYDVTIQFFNEMGGEVKVKTIQVAPTLGEAPNYYWNNNAPDSERASSATWFWKPVARTGSTYQVTAAYPDGYLKGEARGLFPNSSKFTIPVTLHPDFSAPLAIHVQDGHGSSVADAAMTVELPRGGILNDQKTTTEGYATYTQVAGDGQQVMVRVKKGKCEVFQWCMAGTTVNDIVLECR